MRQDMLNIAISQFNIDGVQLVLEAGASAIATDSQGRTCWQVFFEGYRFLSSARQSVDEQCNALIAMLRLFLSHGLTLEDRNFQGLSLLEQALNQYPPPWYFVQLLIFNKVELPTDKQALLKLVQWAVSYRDQKTLAVVITRLPSGELKQELTSFAAVLAIQQYNIDLLICLKELGLEINRSVIFQSDVRQYLIEFAFNLTEFPQSQPSSDADNEHQKTINKIDIIRHLILNGSVLHFPQCSSLLPSLNDGTTFLHRATANNFVEVVALLLQPEYQFQSDLLSSSRLTALHIAIRNGLAPIAQLLLRYHANPNIKMPGNTTVLHVACEKGLIQLIEPLVSAGASLNATYSDFFGFDNLPVQEALICREEGLREKMLSLLLKLGSPVDARVLRSIIYKNFSIDVFKQVADKLDLQAITMAKLLHLTLLYKRVAMSEVLIERYPVLLSLCSGTGVTPLHLATAPGNEAVYHRLLAAGVDSLAIDYAGNDVTTYAICYGTATTLGLQVPVNFNPDEFEHLRVQLRKESEFLPDSEQVSLRLGLLCYKLIRLFSTAKMSLAYIQQFRNNASREPIHDLCLFQLPLTGNWNRPQWVKLVVEQGPSMAAYLHLAPRIEERLSGLPQGLEDVQAVSQTIKYNREVEDPTLAALFKKYLIPETAFERVLDRYEPKTDDNLPPIQVDGSTFNQERYYFTKLASDDRTGFVLGARTHCCQSVGSVGEACAWHGMMSPYGGFYVVFKRDPSEIAKQQRLYDLAKKTHTISGFVEKLASKAQKDKYRKLCASIVDELKVSNENSPVDQTVLICLQKKLYDELQQLEKGELIAQLWAWMNVANTRKILVFDSWERLRPEDDKLCFPFLSKAAELAIENFGIDEVILGMSIQTPNDLPFEVKEISVNPQDYYDYRDSSKQLLVDSREKYLLRKQNQANLPSAAVLAASPIKHFKLKRL